MTDDPAPPGDVEEGRTDTGVFEVQEGADLPVGADDDVDGCEVAMDEAGLLRGLRSACVRALRAAAR